MLEELDHGYSVLEELNDFAHDLLWTWEPRIEAAFQVLDPERWEATRQNPVMLLSQLGEAGVAKAMGNTEAQAALAAARVAYREYYDRNPAFMNAKAPLVIGYFSLEFGLAECLPIYSGGLGVLAGDHLKATSDLGLPLVAVGLLYKQGFGRQEIDPGGRQVEVYTEHRGIDLPVRKVEGVEVEAPIGDRQVKIAVWRAQVGRVPLFLLDTDVESNPPDLRAITDRLYVPEPDRRLRQEIVLGIGGVRALNALGMEAGVFHLNEGHSFLCAIERIRELRASRRMTLEEARLVARAGIVFTTHTPIAAGSDYFEPGLVWDLLGPYLTEVGISFDRFMDLGRQRPGDPRERLCTTYAALRLADQAVGVSRLHGTVSKRLWKDAWKGLPEVQVPIGSVTNGVHMPTWVAPEIRDVLRRYVGPDWWDLDGSDGRWEAVFEIPAPELWSLHMNLKRRLLEFARKRSEHTADLDANALTIGFGRRFAPYKRANLLLQDSPRLAKMLNSAKHPVQFLFAGKAHPADQQGKDIAADVVAFARQHPRVAFLKDYDIELAGHLVRGADVWLNNPRRFLEASGTSGMKAGANGVLNVSILDGWWDEGYRPELGWAIPSGATLDRPGVDDQAEAENLYRLLEREVVPTYFERDENGIPQQWVEMMRASIRHIATEFAARRMVIDYFNTAYAPGARRVEQLRLLPDWGG
ncbi:MAG TPA: alpha-glucan family phosphorylase [Candidatus Acidoferrum sp.]|jgi:starch phosphorylase|nr:alpha-glucan family phosphorylase [Candidatus Acidoferrum sp.]